MKIQHLNYILTLFVGFMIKTLLPQYQAAASVEDSTTYLMDTVSYKEEVATVANRITAPYLSSKEEMLEKYIFWYNEAEFTLQEVINDAMKVKGASVRPMLATETTNDIPWMRIVYDDCTSGKCEVYNYAHLQPIQRNGKWFIKKVIYPNARSRLLQSNGIWVLKQPKDIPYTIRDYVLQYYPVALEHQKRWGIPWQVKLAQGLFESGGGKSRLARLYNQHFGIKVPPSWKGARAGAKDEGGKVFAFAAHTSGIESYEFHSQFLKTYPRYEGVFKYHPDSTYNYTFRALAKDYWNKRAYKPVFHKINGKKTRLLDGKVYRLSGLDIVTIELSRAGYASDYSYSIGLMNTINNFAQANPPTN